MNPVARYEENSIKGDQSMYPSVLPSIPSSEKVVLYTNNATRHESARGSTSGDDLKALRQFAYVYELEVLGEFRDPIRKGSRIGFNRMLAFLRNHSDCRVILVMTPERLSERQLDWFELIDMGIMVVVVGEALPRLSIQNPAFPQKQGGRAS